MSCFVLSLCLIWICSYWGGMCVYVYVYWMMGDFSCVTVLTHNCHDQYFLKCGWLPFLSVSIKNVAEPASRHLCNRHMRNTSQTKAGRAVWPSIRRSSSTFYSRHFQIQQIKLQKELSQLFYTRVFLRVLIEEWLSTRQCDFRNRTLWGYIFEEFPWVNQMGH